VVGAGAAAGSGSDAGSRAMRWKALLKNFASLALAAADSLQKRACSARTSRLPGSACAPRDASAWGWRQRAPGEGRPGQGASVTSTEPGVRRTGVSGVLALVSWDMSQAGQVWYATCFARA